MNSTMRFILVLPLFLVIIIAGCGRSSKTPCSVYGKITYKGQPVTGGTIHFHRTLEQQKGSYGFSITPEGTYSGSSMPAEEYVVTIETESINPKRATPVYMPPMGESKDKMDANYYKKKMQEMGKDIGVTEAQGTYVKIPSKYSDEKTSPLKVKLENGKNVKDFDLTD
jgi:hypothetical protein